ncbi:histone-lysine N-methyltransferase 2D-like [Pyrus ussuriensis x Pyrus communis]|uniref:Histone-lysine N-methyltransferase 2D-like n=1 Tax=Pyrus ussuriensis x Pyrus communis TaxID=2448454 RepID=A0A5N5FRJ6_9ROSA|nr:histone-lysine N-methyltransferase 2D-like [Pyrus ussuriensis x Pyrus communis]
MKKASDFICCSWQHSAYLLATQFATLMKREGYFLSSYQVEPISPKADGGFSSQWHSASISATPSARPIVLPSSTLTPRLSPSGLSPISMQRLSQNIFSGDAANTTTTTKSIHAGGIRRWRSNSKWFRYD